MKMYRYILFALHWVVVAAEQLELSSYFVLFNSATKAEQDLVET